MTRKNPGLNARAQDARAQALSAAVAAAGDVEESEQPEPAEETIGMSLRLPLSLHRQLVDLSHDLKRERGPQRKSRGDSDPLSVHGLIKKAVVEMLGRKR